MLLLSLSTLFFLDAVSRAFANINVSTGILAFVFLYPHCSLLENLYIFMPIVTFPYRGASTTMSSNHYNTNNHGLDNDLERFCEQIIRENPQWLTWVYTPGGETEFSFDIPKAELMAKWHQKHPTHINKASVDLELLIAVSNHIENLHQILSKDKVTDLLDTEMPSILNELRNTEKILPYCYKFPMRQPNEMLVLSDLGPIIENYDSELRSRSFKIRQQEEEQWNAGKQDRQRRNLENMERRKRDFAARIPLTEEDIRIQEQSSKLAESLHAETEARLQYRVERSAQMRAPPRRRLEHGEIVEARREINYNRGHR